MNASSASRPEKEWRIKDAAEPKDILERVEDQVLGRQEKEQQIDNYSLAVTFITKVYVPPKKKISIRQIVMIALPILLVVGMLSMTLYIRYRNIKSKETSLLQYMESGETAKKLASDLKRQEDLAEADQSGR